MKTAPNRPAVHYAASPQAAAEIILFLRAHGLTGIADANPRPEISVAGCSQETLTELIRGWQRRVFQERLAAEAREGRRG